MNVASRIPMIEAPFPVTCGMARCLRASFLWALSWPSVGSHRTFVARPCRRRRLRHGFRATRIRWRRSVASSQSLVFLSLGEVLNSQIPAAGLRVPETARASATRWRRKGPSPQAKCVFVFSPKRSIPVRALRTHSWISVGPVFHRA
jgi:hypothetical protein